MTTHHHSPDELSAFADLIRNEQIYLDHRDGVDRKRRRSRILRGLSIVAIVIAVVLASIGAYVGWALNAPLSAPVVTWQAPQASAAGPAAIALPTEGASAVSVSGAETYFGDAASGIWLTSGTNDPRPIASITKLITALVILDALPLEGADDPGPTITFDKADHDLYDKYYVLGATIAAMPIGSSMSQHDALATMLIPSASNYAEAVSTWAFGSQGAFVSAARDWLTAHGLTGTTIVEPTGLDARNTSTPTDLIAIGKLAAANPAIAKIVAMPSLTLPGPGAMYNTNELLGTDGVSGLKTGNLGDGSHSLLYTASLDVGAGAPLSMTGVVLSGFSDDSVNSTVLTLFDSIRRGFHTVPVVSSGRDVGSVATPWGSTARVIVADSASILTWSDTTITATMETITPTTYEDGAVVGSITWSAGPNSVSVPVEIEGTIVPPTAWWRLTHPSQLGAP
ncbi:D-alanyl-D-alanine carboxypeptidase family protein [Microbacterium sp. DT81.1]|uniref:D-alanyl-D-alanine carboxypeptidase family protein n=1 Tax=Microbacterium sp. DT81.1 TaxID=3393413 RepID=UPI003CF131BD